MEIGSLSVLKARSLKSRCWQGQAPSKDSRDKFFPVSSGFWWLPAILGISWLRDIPLQSLSLSSHGVSPCGGVVLCLSSFYRDTSHITYFNRVSTWIHPRTHTKKPTLFGNRVTFTDPGVSDFDVPTWGQNLTPQTMTHPIVTSFCTQGPGGKKKK